MSPYRLPLFPLPVVLLPGERLPLHIFEERYKRMIGACLEENRPFGVILAEREGIRRVGCTARVVRLLERFPDGRMNILTEGEKRFGVARIIEERAYLEGQVHDLGDRAEEAPSAALLARVLAALGPGERESLDPSGRLRREPGRLSFAVAARLRLPLPLKQEFLEILSVRERLERLVKLLDESRAARARAAEHERRAGHNGHP